MERICFPADRRESIALRCIRRCAPHPCGAAFQAFFDCVVVRVSCKRRASIPGCPFDAYVSPLEAPSETFWAFAFVLRAESLGFANPGKSRSTYTSIGLHYPVPPIPAQPSMAARPTYPLDPVFCTVRITNRALHFEGARQCLVCDSDARELRREVAPGEGRTPEWPGQTENIL